MKRYILFLLLAVSLLSCTNNKQDRYIVLGTGEIPTFLDTKTNEIYTVQPFHDSKPWIYKTPLSDANNSN